MPETLLPSLNLNRLGYFYAVVRCGSQAAAARELELAPSSISEQIKRLEEELGVRLFEKRADGTALTDAGLTCFEHASSIFSTGHRLVQSFSADPPDRVLVRIGIASTVSRAYATELFMPLFERQHLRAQLSHADHHLLLQRLRVGEIDLAMLDARPPLSDRDRITSRVAARPELVVVGTHERTRELRPNPESLDGQPFFHLSGFSALRRKVDLFFHEAGVTPDVIAESDDLDVVREAVLRDHGFAALPRHFVAEDIDQNRLAILFEMPFEVAIYVAHFDDELPEMIRETIDLLSRSCS